MGVIMAVLLVQSCTMRIRTVLAGRKEEQESQVFYGKLDKTI